MLHLGKCQIGELLYWENVVWVSVVRGTDMVPKIFLDISGG